VGTDRKKLQQDSPVRHLDEINIAVLLIHGDRDVVVDAEHSRQLAAALQKAGKSHRAIFLEGATDDLRRKSDRMTLLTELEKFLLQHLGPGKLAAENLSGAGGP
jgi:dipeptidyl aminopeptidase/acylaminoacyl peptidase